MATYPKCFGILFSQQAYECGFCLLNERCRKLSADKPKERDPILVPKDKKSLVLAVCKKYGLSTSYKARDGNIYEVVPEDFDKYVSIDFLVSNKDALEILLTARLPND